VPNPAFVISSASVTKCGSTVTLLFTRTFATGTNPITPSAGYLIAAYSASAALVEHDQHSNVYASVNFVTASSEVQSSLNSPFSILKVFHGIIQWLAFAVLFPFGMLWARFGRTVGSEGTWFKVHRAAQTLACCLAAIGFVTAFIMVQGAHFQPPFHGQTGILLMAWVIAQGVYGYVRPHRVEGKARLQPLARRIFELAHPLSGYLIFVLALVQIFSGLVYFDVSLGIVIAAAVFSFVSIVAFAVLEFMRRRRAATTGGGSKMFDEVEVAFANWQSRWDEQKGEKGKPDDDERSATNPLRPDAPLSPGPSSQRESTRAPLLERGSIGGEERDGAGRSSSSTHGARLSD